MGANLENKNSETGAGGALDLNELNKAVDLVNERIRKETDRLLQIIKDGENDSPVCVEGNTATGYFCMLQVSKVDIARIYLDYDYPLYRVMQAEAPTSMWEDIAKICGIDSISSVDL